MSLLIGFHFGYKVLLSYTPFSSFLIIIIQNHFSCSAILFFKGNVIDRLEHFHQTFYLALDRQHIKSKVVGMPMAKDRQFGISSLILIQKKL